MKSVKSLLVLSLLAGLSAPVLAFDVDAARAEKKASGAYDEDNSGVVYVTTDAFCDGAIPISNGSSVAGSNVGATNYVGNVSGDVLYMLMVPSAAEVTLSTCNSSSPWDAYMRLYNGCPTSGGAQLFSSDDVCSMMPRIVANLSAGTYYVVMEGYSANTGSYQLDVSMVDECLPGPSACDFTIGSGAASYNSSIVSNQSHWYCVTGDPALTTISTCNAGTGVDTMLELWYNGPAGCVQLALDDDDFECMNVLFTILGDADSPFSMLAGGQYYIRVRGYGSNWGNYQLDINGGAPVVDAQEQPVAFSLGQAVPNPFNPSTTINYSVAETSVASLMVYDLAGHAVATLVDGMVEAGSHSVVFDGSHLASGVYFYTLQSGASVQSQKMVLVK